MGKSDRSDDLAALRAERAADQLEYRRKLDEERRLHARIKAALHSEMRQLMIEEDKRHMEALRDLNEGHRRRSG